MATSEAVESKCEMIVSKVGKLEFENVEGYLTILHDTQSKAVPQVDIEGDSSNYIPAHQVCDVNMDSKDKGMQLFASFFGEAKQYYSLLGVTDLGDKNEDCVLKGTKFVVLMDMGKIAQSEAPEALYYSCYFVEVARIYATEHKIDMNRPELIFWAIMYANNHVNADRKTKDGIINLLKENADG